MTFRHFVSRDVKFHENEFPYANISTSQVPAYSSSPPDSNMGIDVDALESDLVDDHATPAIETESVLDPTSSSTSADVLGRGLRDKRPSVLLRDFVTHTLQSSSPSECHRPLPAPQLSLKALSLVLSKRLCKMKVGARLCKKKLLP